MYPFILSELYGNILKEFLKNYHLILLSIYISIVTKIAFSLKSPNVEFEKSILIIGASALLSLLLFFKSKKYIKPLRVLPKDLNVFFRYYDIVMIALTIICFGSFLISYYENIQLFDNAFSYSLRLITTALHPLLPLESRLFHTLIPFSLIVPYGNPQFKKVLWLLYAILVCLLQIKIAPIFLFVLIFFKLCSLNKVNIYKKVAIGFLSMAFSCGLFIFISQSSARDFENLMKNTHLMKNMGSLPSQEIISHTMFKDRCSPKPDTVLNSLPFINHYLTYRIFYLPSIVSRLFVCARENQFEGNFRGHQLARVIGAYRPVYNILYTTYFPEQAGFTYANAVGNYVFDSFFQIGWSGIFLSLVVIFCILHMINLIDNYGDFKPLGHLMKFTLIYGTLTSSLISVLLFFIPLSILILFLYFYPENQD